MAHSHARFPFREAGGSVSAPTQGQPLTFGDILKMNAIAILPLTGFMRLPAVLSLIPVARSTWWAGVKSGRYPAPVKLGPRMTAWKAEDVRSLINALGAQ
jgi:Predicted transcriptional regulator